MKKYCVNIECINKTGCIQVEHLDLGPTMEPGKTAQYIKFKCTLCGCESNEVKPRVSKRKQVGSFYHAGLDKQFDDSDHERKWTKANGYDPV